MATHSLVVAAAALCALGGLARQAGADPCASIRATPVEQLARQVSQAFEGVVVDDWSEVVQDRSRLRVLRHYTFRVVRNWSSNAPTLLLTHGWYTLPPGVIYPVFERGQRYLVFANFHDMPAHTFTASCYPLAAGDAVPALAARLGPPVATFPDVDGPAMPLRTRLARDILINVRATVTLIVWGLGIGQR